MEDEKDAFYIVRKGDIIGVYRSLSECQEQAGSSVSHPAMSVYKGYGWPKEAEEFISSFGIKNALFSVNASYVKDDAFGKLIPCPVQQPSSSQEGTFEKSFVTKRQLLASHINTKSCSESFQVSGESSPPPQKHPKIETGIVPPQVTALPPSSHYLTQLHIPKTVNTNTNNSVSATSCIIEFDGASKGNPGKAGAGAVIRGLDKTVLFHLREGVGIATNNVAEYRALILGMKSALDKGFRNIRVQGDSMLVCMQIQDKWKTKHPKMAELCMQAKELKSKFKSFHIQHIAREFNSDADTQANEAIRLKDGETEVIPVGFRK